MNLNGKNILITGGAGLIGSNLTERLIKQYECKVTSVYNNQVPRSTSHIPFSVKGDLTDQTFCDQITKNKDIVFHCAAKSFGAATMEENPTCLIRDNIVMNINMLESCLKNNVKKFVWLASTTGYPNTTEKVTEDMMFLGEPFEKYYAVGWVKRYTEVLCKLFSEKLKKTLPCIVLRPSNVFGPNDKIDPKKSHVLSALMRKVIEKQNPIEVWGDGMDERDLLYVDDMVDAMILSTEKIEKFEQINVGYGTTYKVLDILNMIQSAAGYSAPYKLIPTGPRMIPVRRVDISKIKSTLNWSPKVSIQDGIKHTYEWMKKELL
jgi:GDP-L-fucose synthase